MAQNPVKFGTFTATTNGTVALTTAASGFGAFPPNNQIAGHGANVWCEITSVGSGSAWATGSGFKWTSPGGNALSIGTIGAVTSTTNSQMLTLAAAFVDATKLTHPPITHVQVTVQTAGTTTSLIGDLYIIPAI